jgi:hypothetical protein
MDRWMRRILGLAAAKMRTRATTAATIINILTIMAVRAVIVGAILPNQEVSGAIGLEPAAPRERQSLPVVCS